MKIFNIILLAIIAAIATARLSVAPRNKRSNPKTFRLKHRSGDVSDVDEAASSTVSGVVDAATSASGEDEFTATSDSEGDKSTVTNASAKGISRAANASGKGKSTGASTSGGGDDKSNRVSGVVESGPASALGGSRDTTSESVRDKPISNSTAGGGKSRDTPSDSRADNPIGNGESGGDTTVGTKKGKEPLTKEEQLNKTLYELGRKMWVFQSRKQEHEKALSELDTTTLSGTVDAGEKAKRKVLNGHLKTCIKNISSTEGNIKEAKEKIFALRMDRLEDDFKVGRQQLLQLQDWAANFKVDDSHSSDGDNTVDESQLDD
eukprot:GHVS01068229.1.p1 GENE.GHVS01068229.1~~GHVS01068229.1.p1  ORF type:complete len:320 (-),score=34.82 GHVS01068229.1:115-1074(-)